MLRREFIGILGIALVSGFRAAARTGAKRIGVLSVAPPERTKALLDAVRDGVSPLEFVYHYSVGNSLDALIRASQKFEQDGMDAMLAIGDIAAAAAVRSHVSVPVVFVVGVDPVAAGLVDTLNRPGNNITGLTNINVDLNVKRLEILKELLPSLERVDLIFNPYSTHVNTSLASIAETATGMGLDTRPLRAEGMASVESALDEVLPSRTSAVLFVADALFNTFSAALGDLCGRRNIPAIYSLRSFVEGGGLVSYGPDTFGMFRQAGGLLRKVLLGTSAGDLPVERPQAFELVIGGGAASKLNITIPEGLVVQASLVP